MVIRSAVFFVFCFCPAEWPFCVGSVGLLLAPFAPTISCGMMGDCVP